MEQPPFLRQTDQPLFPKILWNRPVNRAGAGRLLIVGGHSGDLSQVQAAYQFAQAAGIGACRVVLPDSLARMVAGLPDMLLVPSSHSGSLGRGAMAEILRLSEDYDAVLLGLNLSNNSETSVLTEGLVGRISGALIMAGDGLEAIKFNAEAVTGNPDCLIVADMRQVFRLASALKVGLSIKPDAGILNQAGIAHRMADAGKATYLIYDGRLIAADTEQVSITDLRDETASYAGAISGLAATMWLQNRSKHFEATTSACYLFAQALMESEGPNLQALAAAIRRTLDKEDFV